MSNLNKARFKELEKKASSKTKANKKDDIGNFIDNELKMFKVNTKPNINNDNDNDNYNENNINLALKTNLLNPLNKDEPLKIPSNLRIGIKNSEKPVIPINNISKKVNI
jgi:hypothetical protein